MTDPQLIVRKANRNDADALFALVADFAISFKAERTAFISSLEALLPDESAQLIVGELNGDVIAYCLGFDHFAFYANGRVSWVEEIMVRADLRRNGVGTAPMAAFEAWAAKRGSKLVGLATRRASSFYQALGYEDSAVFYRKILLKRNLK